MKEWYSNSWSDVVEKLNSDARNGLSLSQVEMLSKNKNEKAVINSKNKTLNNNIKSLIKQVWLFILIMVLISCIFLINNMIIESIVVFLILFVNTFLMFINEFKNSKKLNELEKLNPRYAKIVREGKIMKISSEELVIGDIVFVDKGESAAADLRIIESDNLKVKETAVTGEIYVSEKYEAKIDEDELSLSEMKNILFKSSVVVNGSATGIVIAEGKDTQIDNVINMFIEENENDNTFKTSLYKIIDILSKISAGIFIISIIFGLILNKHMNEVLINADIIALSVMPVIGIILIVMISYLILKEFKKNGAVFKDLSVVKEFTDINVLCLDKIGILCKSEMNVVKMYSSEKLINLTDMEGLDEITYSMLKIALICNDSISEYIQHPNSINEISERAFIKLGEKYNVIKSEILKENPRIFQIQYDSDRDMMTVVTRLYKFKNISYRSYTRGSVENLLTKCTHILKNGIEKAIATEDIEKYKEIDNSFCCEGFFVIAYAYRNFTYKPSLSENIESNLVFVGIAAVENPINEGLAESIEFCKNNNIQPVIFTDENKLTATAFGKADNLIFSDENVISNVELDNITDDELEKNIKNYNIFSKVKPEQKLRISKMFMEQGYKSAFGGTKLSDISALRKSNVSIAVGDNCSDVIKNTSDIYLKNTIFLNIINIFKNSKKALFIIFTIISYYIVCNIIQGSLSILGLLFCQKAVFTFIEIIWFNIYSIMLSSIVLYHQIKSDPKSFESFSIDKYIFKNFIDKKIIIQICYMIISSFLILIISNYGVFSKFTIFELVSLSELFLIYAFFDSSIFKNRKSNLFILFGSIIQFSMIFISKEIVHFSDSLKIADIIVILIFVIIEVSLITYFKLKKDKN
ncbi:MAG: hypothetical protein Q8900_00230 [Bacillota bacterium]|nr:hypothetical protein [Bacillota bacterium]